VILFDLLAAPPPPTADIHEVSFFCEIRSEPRHVVGVPRRLYSGDERYSFRLIHRTGS